MRKLTALAIAVPIALSVACSKDEPTTSGTPSATASAVATPSVTASATAAPSAAASAAPEPHHDCPANSTGVGSLTEPCVAKGAERLMTVKWTKTDDKGPNFSIKNTGKITILYGKIVVYFYDKAGKQLELKDESETPPKMKQFHVCSGSFFQGVMKPGESATLTFSCVPKKIIPDGTATIEAEMQTVGFADSTEKKIDFYWRNPDLSPAARPKGGASAK